MSTTHTTENLTSQFATAESFQGFDALIITTADAGYTISFDDVEAAVTAVDKAKDKAFRLYCKNGGNPRNKRSFGSQFAAVKRAIVKAAS